MAAERMQMTRSYSLIIEPGQTWERLSPAGRVWARRVVRDVADDVVRFEAVEGQPDGASLDLFVGRQAIFRLAKDQG